MNAKPKDFPVLALTIGEPAGIGPDIAIDAWLDRDSSRIPPFLFIGAASVLEERARHMGRAISAVDVAPEDARATFASAIPCMGDATVAAVTPSHPNPRNAAVTIGAIEAAADLVRAGRCSAIVTNPVHKKTLSEAGFAHPGHTEFLGELSRRLFKVDAQPVMMLAAPMLRTVPVTVHIALRDVFDVLSADLIVETGRIVATDLATRFGIRSPRIAVAGLNPHAGEDGLMGSEESATIRPAIDRLVAEGIAVTGPFPADSMFHEAARPEYDAALCMYHDQALIPVKALAFDSAVNVTLGLPFVRTSPDHGTAFTLAGSGKASAKSLIAALRMAEDLASGSHKE